MAGLRQHGELAEPTPQFAMPVEGVCVSYNGLYKTIMFTIPSVAEELLYGPAPYTGTGSPEAGTRLLVVFASNGRAWVVGSTTQT